MKTITLQIGNTDDKLTQAQWASYVAEVRQEIADCGQLDIHFFGTPPNYERWQNACWVLAVGESSLNSLKDSLVKIRRKWLQDSIAWTEGGTEFI